MEPLLGVFGSLQLLNSSHVRERERQGFVKECHGQWCLERFSFGKGQRSACSL